jgi:hypothetical protein
MSFVTLNQLMTSLHNSQNSFAMMNDYPTKSMTLIETIDHFIQDQQGHLQCIEWDIREETNQEEPDLDWYCEQYDTTKHIIEDLQEIKSELARLQRYDEELSAVMPRDYKDWWENSKEEWPEIAKASIQSLREREELAWDHSQRATENVAEDA